MQVTSICMFSPHVRPSLWFYYNTNVMLRFFCLREQTLFYICICYRLYKSTRIQNTRFISAMISFDEPWGQQRGQSERNKKRIFLSPSLFYVSNIWLLKLFTSCRFLRDIKLTDIFDKYLAELTAFSSFNLKPCTTTNLRYAFIERVGFLFIAVR